MGPLAQEDCVKPDEAYREEEKHYSRPNIFHGLLLPEELKQERPKDETPRNDRERVDEGFGQLRGVLGRHFTDPAEEVLLDDRLDDDGDGVVEEAQRSSIGVVR